MNTHTDTEAHNSFSGILNIEEYFPFLRKISRNFLENFLRNIFPEKQHHYSNLSYGDRHIHCVRRNSGDRTGPADCSLTEVDDFVCSSQLSCCGTLQCTCCSDNQHIVRNTYPTKNSSFQAFLQILRTKCFIWQVYMETQSYDWLLYNRRTE